MCGRLSGTEILWPDKSHRHIDFYSSRSLISPPFVLKFSARIEAGKFYRKKFSHLNVVRSLLLMTCYICHSLTSGLLLKMPVIAKTTYFDLNDSNQKHTTYYMSSVLSNYHNSSSLKRINPSSQGREVTLCDTDDILHTGHFYMRC